jgi:hypothetical protein
MPESRIPIIIAWIFQGCSVVARIHSEIEVTNTRSVKMHKKVDFDNEALFRELTKRNGKQGTGQISRIGIPNSQRRLGIKRVKPYVSATCTQRPINQESKFDLSLDRSVTQPPGHFAHRLDSGRKARNRYLTCPLIPISLSDLSLLYLSGANGRLRRQTKAFGEELNSQTGGGRYTANVFGENKGTSTGRK